MDTQKLFDIDLAQIMDQSLEEIDAIVQKHPVPQMTLKPDGTPVTTLDFALSTYLEKKISSTYQGINLYSEENEKKWIFPSVAIDPLDGTREYIKNRPQWAISLALLMDERLKGQGWVYNPATKELFSQQQQVLPFISKSLYHGEVSHTEWERGYFEGYQSAQIGLNDFQIQLSPMGSIAYKLARLSAGKIDFVVSLAPKNLWDIAGGSLLCQSAGIKFYSMGKEVTDVCEVYQPPLIWSSEKISSKLLAFFAMKDRYL